MIRTADWSENPHKPLLTHTVLNEWHAEHRTWLEEEVRKAKGAAPNTHIHSLAPPSHLPPFFCCLLVVLGWLVSFCTTNEHQEESGQVDGNGADSILRREV
eukprot:TRINITY_DN2512_c1_g2_i1.p3 TRINITY_DN2512_c1_g2~~TRINITY_DN2512_c1_g2_i1.p3  ORF type:complete len:101 (-),score=12.70 TRINITY_DN2512_c1_g2_i1:665-967(-)